MVAADGVVYLNLVGQGIHPTVIAYQVSTNSVLWSTEISALRGSPVITPALSATKLVARAAGHSSPLIALDRNTGNIAWTRYTGPMLSHNPIIDGSRLYVQSDSIYCLNVDSGEDVWIQPIPGGFVNGTVTIHERYLFYSDGDSLYAHDKLTGARIWTYPGILSKALCVYNDTVYASGNINGQNAVVALNAETGIVNWMHELPEDRTISYYTGDGGFARTDRQLLYHLEYTGSEAAMNCVNLSDGTPLWDHTTIGSYFSGFAIVNDIVFAVNRTEHKIAGFNIETGDIVFEDTSELYHQFPIYANGRVFVPIWNSNGFGASFASFKSASSGIDDVDTKRPFYISVFPSPATTNVTISVNQQTAVHHNAVVHDIMGRVVFRSSSTNALNGTSWFVNTSTWNPGIYFVQVTGGSAARIGKLLVVK
jgi:outer membrane protein assembly factor BamB